VRQHPGHGSGDASRVCVRSVADGRGDRLRGPGRSQGAGNTIWYRSAARVRFSGASRRRNRSTLGRGGSGSISRPRSGVSSNSSTTWRCKPWGATSERDAPGLPGGRYREFVPRRVPPLRSGRRTEGVPSPSAPAAVEGHTNIRKSDLITSSETTGARTRWRSTRSS
jgi:hypothetical protein